MIYCRDEASVEIVSRFTVGNVKRVGDLAFLLPMTEYGKLLEAHPELKRLPAEFIGVSVSNLFASSIAGANPEIATADDFFAATAECLDRLVNKYGMPIVFFSHVVFPDTVDDDRRAAARVAGRMKTKPIVLQDEYLASEIKAAMHLSKVFIGCRMHALIGSFSSGVPIIALAYSPKTVAVIGEGISYPYVIDLRSGSLADYKKAVETHLEDILNNYGLRINSSFP